MKAMKVSELIRKLQAFNPEAEVFQLYDGMVQQVQVRLADGCQLGTINCEKDGQELDFAVVFGH